jgi:hypothetical protein
VPKGARGALFQGWTGIETLFFEECGWNFIADEFDTDLGWGLCIKA